MGDLCGMSWRLRRAAQAVGYVRMLFEAGVELEAILGGSKKFSSDAILGTRSKRWMERERERGLLHNALSLAFGFADGLVSAWGSFLGWEQLHKSIPRERLRCLFGGKIITDNLSLKVAKVPAEVVVIMAVFDEPPSSP
mmetsp:Transcript_63307/g.169265  ORF Transcript_63307/g.169265 Transcript_63307/m.169265 type:complete len:139 (-) Transcript_63307:392-808(-)